MLRQVGVSQAGDKLKGKANEAGRKAQNAVGNTSQLPSPQDVRHSHRQEYLIGLCGVVLKALSDNSPSHLLASRVSHG